MQEQFAPHMNRQNPLDMQFIDPAEVGNDLLDSSSGVMQEGMSEGFSRHANTTASLNTMAEVTGGVRQMRRDVPVWPAVTAA